MMTGLNTTMGQINELIINSNRGEVGHIAAGGRAMVTDLLPRFPLQGVDDFLQFIQSLEEDPAVVR